MTAILTASPLIAGKLVRTSLPHPSAFSQQRPPPFLLAPLHIAVPSLLSTRSRFSRAELPLWQPVECKRVTSQLSRSSERDNIEAGASAAFSSPLPSAQPAVSIRSLPVSLLSLLPLILADRALAESVPLLENGADVLTAAGGGDTVTNGVISVLFVVAVVGLTVLTGGVGYLAYTDWQDKREMEKLAAAEPVKRPGATSEIRAAMKSPPRATPKGFGKKSEKEKEEESDA
ncbi:hypothetical protein CLOM_g2304 [Closterium sp. NIES-68]|nr:hypothetical protein CLOM_g2304 [Closterium sp. NIES-68]